MARDVWLFSKGKKNRLRTTSLYHTLTLFGIGCVLTIIITLVQPFHNIDLWISDQLFLPEAPSKDIVVVGIDDQTLNTYGKWSEWPRSLHAEAINNLSQARAKVIGLDILFVDSSQDDQILATAMENANNVVIPYMGLERIPNDDSEITYDSVLLPAVPFRHASKSTGHANIAPDSDGTVRRLPLVIKDRLGRTYPTFDLAILHSLFSQPLPENYSRQDGSIQLLDRNIPVDNSYSLRIDFSAEAESRPYISYGDVIKGNFDPQVVRNKIVLVGMTATGEFDTWKIPNSLSKVPGVFIHAAVLDNILRQQFLRETGIGSTLITILLMLLVAVFTLPRLRLRWGGMIILGMFIGYLIVGSVAFSQGYIISIFYPVMFLSVMYVSNVLSYVVIEQSDKRFIQDLFGRYVSPQVAGEIIGLANTGDLKLGGEQREVTVLFADVRDFTKLSEKMSPEAVMNMLNTYLSIAIDRVIKNGGIVNKFAGDNIMAVWNAPQPQSDHALPAIRTAWETQQIIIKLQENDPSLPRVKFGIGINTGYALAGNLGSSGRTEYTVIGDTVNIASRICSATPGGEIWIGPETYRQAADYLKVNELEPQTFKGKTERVKVYQVIDCKCEL